MNAVAAAVDPQALDIPAAPPAIVSTSGETSDDDEMSLEANNDKPDEDDKPDDDEDDDTRRFTQADELFDAQLDDNDEAYVYKHLRSGVQETVTVKRDTERQEIKVFKPRNSDAVLSCPCCFQIVCMDCQRHDRYPNQYRAMFVMGITVRWDQRLVYDDKNKGLVQYDTGGGSTNHTSTIPASDSAVYYTVCCANCQTTVAALDMEEEVYHFYGCLASA
jgi:hypothetical protein